MSNQSHSGAAAICGKQELVAWFEKSCLPIAEQLVGVEHEKPPFYLDNAKPVPYAGADGRAGIRDLMQGLSDAGGWMACLEQGNIVALQKGRRNWTFEPGGQMETGGAPVKSLHQVAAETDATIAEAVATAKNLGIGLLALGYHPTHGGADMPFMPKSRFLTWRDYVQRRRFPNALEGMVCTSTVQVNLGYESERDMVDMLRVGLSLQPVAVALFANSPFCNGVPSGFQSYRSHVIHNYMGGRFGFMLPVAFEEGFGFSRFVDYAMNEMPMIGIYKDDVFIDAQGGRFADFMQGKLAVYPGHKASTADWENHLNTIWPEVRLRRFLEMRGADSGPAEMIKALPAFWTGLLYDKGALTEAVEMIKGWTHEDREYLRATTPRHGLQTPFRGGTVGDIAKACLALAEKGLKRRALHDGKGRDESVYLAPLHAIAESGRTWAQRLVERFDTAWKGDINKLFDEHVYENAPSVMET